MLLKRFWPTPTSPSAAAVFVYGLIPQIFAHAVNYPIQKFLQAQSIVAPSGYITVAALVIHILLNWVVVYNVRVSNELGAGHPKSSAFSVVVVTLSFLLISIIFAILALVFRHDLSYAFTSGTAVADAVAELASYLAAAIILNGSNLFYLAFVAYANVGCYYFVGVPLGILLGFTYNLGAKGIWSGMMGGTLMQTLILLWVTCRTDWRKEVK
ncbi:hypothetical protein L6164_018335 [Bauhinia variegata]|uniref:Uncharacterized protein n=1 Tax=Bauhinia variegata TaxID=167791 RepID=A0ACB9NFP8_BAUVA|nr:hypothetical protein L6164_018335 [Bauhinia variegata]